MDCLNWLIMCWGSQIFLFILYYELDLPKIPTQSSGLSTGNMISLFYWSLKIISYEYCDCRQYVNIKCTLTLIRSNEKIQMIFLEYILHRKAWGSCSSLYSLNLRTMKKVDSLVYIPLRIVIQCELRDSLQSGIGIENALESKKKISNFIMNTTSFNR